MGLCRSSLTALIATAVLAGCGSVAHSSGQRRASSHPLSEVPNVVPPAGAPQNELGLRIPAPRPTGIRVSGSAVAVIRAWADALRSGNLTRAARYFAVPSVMIYGPGPAGGVLAASIQSRRAAVTANAALPCGAVFLSADQRGRYVNALFRLTNRVGRGGGCTSGTGLTARTNFVIAHGLIVQWIRAPDDAGDNARQHRSLPAPVRPGPPLPAQPATPVA